MVTRKIHQIWLQGEDKLPTNYKKFQEKYKKLNTKYGWKYKLWDKVSIRNLIATKYPHLLCIFDNYPFWVMGVDLGKYCILDSEGGLLVDMDTKPFNSFEKIIPYFKGKPTFVYYPRKKGKNFHFHFLEQIFVYRITNNNFIYIPYPGHKFTQLLLKRAACMSERTFIDFKLYYILGSIGPLFLIDTIEEYGRDKVAWIKNTSMDKIFIDERANSWNKKHYDNHDIFWGITLVFIFLLAIWCLYKTV